MGFLKNATVIGVSAAAGAAATQAYSSARTQAESQVQAKVAEAKGAADKAKSAAQAKFEGGKAELEGKLDEALESLEKGEPPETLVLNLQKNGYKKEGSKLSVLFTIDKLVKGGDAVEGVTSEEVTITEDDEEVSPDEGWRRFTSEFRDVRVNHRMLLDLSGSSNTPESLNALAKAAAKYVDKVLGAKDSGKQFIAIDGFDGALPVSIVSYSQDAKTLKDALANPCGSSLCKDPSTNLNGALTATIAQLEAEADDATTLSEGAIVLFTDGVDQAGTMSMKKTLERSEESSIHVYTISVGEKVDQDKLGALGKAGTFLSHGLKNLSEAALLAADRTPPLAKHFYRVEYCTPKRNGPHTLKVKIRHKDNEKVELVGSLSLEFDVRTDAFECDIPKPRY